MTVCIIVWQLAQAWLPRPGECLHTRLLHSTSMSTSMVCLCKEPWHRPVATTPGTTQQADAYLIIGDALIKRVVKGKLVQLHKFGQVHFDLSAMQHKSVLLNHLLLVTHLHVNATRWVPQKQRIGATTCDLSIKHPAGILGACGAEQSLTPGAQVHCCI